MVVLMEAKAGPSARARHVPLSVHEGRIKVGRLGGRLTFKNAYRTDKVPREF